MANYSFDVGNSAINSYKTSGQILADWTGPGGPACAGLDLLTRALKPTTLAQMQSVAYDSATYAFPVANGKYNIYIIAYGAPGSNYNRTCIVDGVTKFTGWNPYVDAGNTNKAVEKLISNVTVTGGSCSIQVTAVGGVGFDVWSWVIFEEIPDTTPPSDVSNLSATKVSNAQVNIDSDAATDDVGVMGYTTQRRINGGSWGTLTPTAKNFSDTENFPTTPGTYTFEYRRKAFDAYGNPSANWSNITNPVSITVVAQLLSNYSPNSALTAPVTITFDDISVGIVTDQKISFGDYSNRFQADDANFAHRFLAPGKYKFERWAKLSGIPSYETYEIIIGGNPPTPPLGAIEFDEIELPRYYSEGASGGPVFSTSILGNTQGVQQRNINRPVPIHEFELNFLGERQFSEQFEDFLDFFHTRNGQGIGFRFFPFVDNRWNDEQIALTNPAVSEYKLIRTYSRGGRTLIRRIVKPVPDLIVTINGQPAANFSAYTIDYTIGKIIFANQSALPVNGILRVSGEYCIPVVFADDRLSITGFASYADLNGLRVVELLPAALGITD